LLRLVDELLTSDDYILEKIKRMMFMKLADKVSNAFSMIAERLWAKF